MFKDSKKVTTFLTRFGEFKYFVIQFDLGHNLASYEHLIYNTLIDFLHCFVQIYFDDIFIYTNILQDHCSYFWQVLQCSQEPGQQVNIDKSEFLVQETQSICLIVPTEGIPMDLQKVMTICGLTEQTSLCHIRSFFWFYNFY